MRLRNNLHKGDFRLYVTPELWSSLYTPESKMVTVTNNQTLRGYAVCSLFVQGESKAYMIRDICADTDKTLLKLIDQIVESGLKDEVDFIFLRKCEEPFDYVFDKKGFLSLVESVVMVSLLNPQELLMVLSEKTERGKILDLHLKGFNPIKVRVDKDRIEVVKDGRSDLKVFTDSKTFIKLFLGDTSFIKEFIKGKVLVDGKTNILTVSRFFKCIKQNKLYLPLGDWS